MQETSLTVGIALALAFPIMVLIVHQSWNRRRDRRAGRRRTEKIRL